MTRAHPAGDTASARARPILFGAPMVRALRAGRKQETRRVVRQPDAAIRCPYGAPGDLLWVKETWREERGGYRYRADGGEGPWKSALFMPRAASRLVLRVTGVRAEPLQAITESGARAEGVEPEPAGDPATAHRRAYATLWDRINAARGHPWSSNPRVWVVRFEVLD